MNAPGTDAAVLAGYEHQRTLLFRNLGNTGASVHESAYTSSGFVAVVLVKPLSRGTVVIVSATDPLAQPAIDFNAFANPADLDILVPALRLDRQAMASQPMAALGPVETLPGQGVDGQEALRAAMKANVQPSWAHPCCTAAMMPRKDAGVVDADLMVYGIKGLRMVDASIMPLIPGTHLQATVYAIAEKV
jgi:choline dehydrogenase-like flavoprotein